MEGETSLDPVVPLLLAGATRHADAMWQLYDHHLTICRHTEKWRERGWEMLERCVRADRRRQELLQEMRGQEELVTSVGSTT